MRIENVQSHFHFTPNKAKASPLLRRGVGVRTPLLKICEAL